MLEDDKIATKSFSRVSWTVTLHTNEEQELMEYTSKETLSPGKTEQESPSLSFTEPPFHHLRWSLPSAQHWVRSWVSVRRREPGSIDGGIY